jgi:endoglucanase
MVSWGITAVRLPLNEACWLGVEGSPGYGTVAGYKAAIADWVAILNAAGLVVILDLHWTSPPGYPANGQRAMTSARSVTFWQQVAAAYAGNGSVMFDAFNEPYSRWNNATSSWAFQLTWACWRDGGCSAPVENDQTGTLSGTKFTVAGMSSLVAAIRGAGADQPILLGGLDYSNDLRGWLAHRPADSQLVASWHNYPAQRCRTTTCWNAEILPVAAVVPVIATEFGQTDGGNSFLTAFMDWADTHGIGYAPWAWWRTDASDGTAANLYALIADDQFTPKYPAGTALHDHLASLAGSGRPFGALETVTSAPGGVTATGWAIDDDAGADPIRIGISIDGVFGEEVVADEPRADIGEQYPDAGADHGFAVTLTTPAGSHEICVYGIDPDSAATSLLGCKRAAALTGNPIGRLTTATAVPGGARITGWIYDPDTAEPASARVYVDGRLVREVVVDGTMPASATVPALYGDAHGFDEVLLLPTGTHAICVHAIDVGVGTNVKFTCKSVSSRSGSPFGTLETASASALGVTYRGWTFDRDSAAPIEIQVTLDGIVVATETADVPRPDIGRRYPVYGDEHGFSGRVAAAAGSHRVCVTAINVDLGTDFLLGCRTVVVPTGSVRK